MYRDKLLNEYICGKGIEIGALQNPVVLDNSKVIEIKYVDRSSVKDLRKQYPELKDCNLTEPDIIDDAEVLSKIEDNSLDFIIANHVIEHMENPINAINNWLSKLNNGGIIFMAVPDKNFTFDKIRKETTWKHLYEDYKYKKLREKRNYKHFLDFAKAFPEEGKTADIKAKELIDKSYSIHFHCWTYLGFKSFLNNCIKKINFSFKIIEDLKTEKGGNEFIFILKKEVKKMQEGIDIILPTFNAFEYVKECVKSIIKNTNLEQNQLIIINDNSTDKELLNYLNLITYKNIKIINNKKNLGFVRSVNKGMKMSVRDVILLNTDTVVTKGWIEKLTACAYSSPTIATVTPLSNNATICSVPNFGYDNQLPDGFNIQSFANLIEEKSLNLFLNLPTGIGFCLYIKRQIIDKFGVFDDDLFENGYGEENEFCARVGRLGFENVVCDNTFIYHKGSASFTDKKRIRKVKKHLRIINKLYPGYSQSIKDFVIKNPLKPVHKNIDFWLNHKELFLSKKRKVLMVMHYEPSVGGVGINTNQICDHNVNEFDFYLFSTTESGEVVIKVRNNNQWVVLWKFNNMMSDPYSIRNREIEDIFDKTLKYLNIDMVHFQHMMGVPLSLLEIPKKLGLKSMVSLHDYYFLSTSPQLIGRENLTDFNFSSDGIEDGLKLLKCHFNLEGKHGFDNDSYRISWTKEYFNSIDEIVSPSRYVKELYETVLDLDKNKIKVKEHGIGFQKTNNIILKEKDKFVIAFLGVASHHKGFKDFISLINENISKKIKWVIIGDVNQEWLDYINEQKIFDQNFDVEFTGYYDVNLLEKVISDKKINLVIQPSIFPETYSYTLSESIQCNIPVLARDIGALGDRVKRYGYGWVYRYYRELVSKLRWLIDNKDVVKQKSLELKDKKIGSSVAMAKWYGAEYKILARGYHYFIENYEANRFFENAIVEDYTTSQNKLISGVNNNRNRLKMIIKKTPGLGRIALKLKRIIFD